MVKQADTLNGLDKTVKVNVTVPASIIGKIRAESKRQQRTLSNMVTLILKDHLSKQK